MAEAHLQPRRLAWEAATRRGKAALARQAGLQAVGSAHAPGSLEPAPRGRCPDPLREPVDSWFLLKATWAAFPQIPLRDPHHPQERHSHPAPGKSSEREHNESRYERVLASKLVRPADPQGKGLV